MRRKSERTASKKANPSPEKKLDKAKRTRTRRRKQSSSTENESAEESSPVREVEKVPEPEKKPPQTPIKVKEDSPEETPDQVWQVKTTDAGDVGEIQKLKICLTRPPSTPERVDRSPRSRRKHSRATSSSDTPSVETPEDKKKSKHRSKRSRESKEDSDKVQDGQGDEIEAESEVQTSQENSLGEVSQSDTAKESSSVEVETPVSTTNEENKTTEKTDSVESQDSQKTTTTDVEGKTTDCEINETEEGNGKTLDADTTVVSPKAETTATSEETDTVLPINEDDKKEQATNTSTDKESPVRKRSVSVDKSEVLELHAEENRLESPEKEVSKPDKDKVEEDTTTLKVAADDVEVSKTEDKTDSKEPTSVNTESNKDINIPGVVESPDCEKKSRKESTDSRKEHENEKINKNVVTEQERHKNKVVECSDSTQSSHDETIPNGQAAPIVINRKRRWGSRVTKLTTQKSITISTDILKDIIPDVKPVEFDEVIEEKKHKRIDASEKLERPVLPKIIIDNTENVELNRKENEDKERDIVKPKETNLAMNRKISIVKDNDSIITRPPSPPRHKQSCILFITNLVRPFTLPQLKNLLQRTGRIAENGFWIDKIKSKCFVRYETEDQAVETRHALHGVTWPVSNPKTLQVDFSTDEAFDKAKLNEDTDNAQASTIPGTVEDWLREQDMKRERGELDKPWERKAITREWDVGKNEKDKDKVMDKDKEKLRRDERPMEKRRHRTPERSPEPARKFKKKEEEAPAKLLDDLFRKTKATPCIYWLPLSAETIAIKEEQRRHHMAEHERRLQEIRRTHRRH